MRERLDRRDGTSRQAMRGGMLCREFGRTCNQIRRFCGNRALKDAFHERGNFRSTIAKSLMRDAAIGISRYMVGQTPDRLLPVVFPSECVQVVFDRQINFLCQQLGVRKEVFTILLCHCCSRLQTMGEFASERYEIV